MLARARQGGRRLAACLSGRPCLLAGQGPSAQFGQVGFLTLGAGIQGGGRQVAWVGELSHVHGRFTSVNGPLFLMDIFTHASRGV